VIGESGDLKTWFPFSVARCTRLRRSDETVRAGLLTNAAALSQHDKRDFVAAFFAAIDAQTAGQLSIPHRRVTTRDL
jgi:hypothetical protein